MCPSLLGNSCTNKQGGDGGGAPASAASFLRQGTLHWSKVPPANHLPSCLAHTGASAAGHYQHRVGHVVRESQKWSRSWVLHQTPEVT